VVQSRSKKKRHPEHYKQLKAQQGQHEELLARLDFHHSTLVGTGSTHGAPVGAVLRGALC